MEDWPEITEPLLRERQSMSDDAFVEFWGSLLDAVGTRVLDDEHYERAIGYPWSRPPGSCFVTNTTVEELSDADDERRRAIVDEYGERSGERIPLLAYGANASPERLAMKLAHLPNGHREALIIAGHLEGFDIGAVAQPPVWSSMAATLISSPGTEVRVSVLYLTPVQFTALWWTELSYKLGALTGVRLEADGEHEPLERVLLFVSRFGAFCVDGAPVVMSAIPARHRRFTALSQLEILEAAARMAIGDGAGARDLIRCSYESPARFAADHHASFQAASVPFASEHWTEMPVR